MVCALNRRGMRRLWNWKAFFILSEYIIGGTQRNGVGFLFFFAYTFAARPEWKTLKCKGRLVVFFFRIVAWLRSSGWLPSLLPTPRGSRYYWRAELEHCMPEPGVISIRLCVCCSWNWQGNGPRNKQVLSIWRTAAVAHSQYAGLKVHLTYFTHIFLAVKHCSVSSDEWTSCYWEVAWNWKQSPVFRWWNSDVEAISWCPEAFYTLKCRGINETGITWN